MLAITREGLSNIARHSRRDSGVGRPRHRMMAVRLTIGDNGRGFDPAEPRSAGSTAWPTSSHAPRRVGGTLPLTSEPGAGTRLISQRSR